MELRLIADTNLFFECKQLENLPWRELEYDSIVIELTKPVLDEIDQHKKSTGRTRKRALAIWKIVRDLIQSSSDQNEHIILATGPRVVLRLSDALQRDSNLSNTLDYNKTDEKLVGIVSELNKCTTDTQIKLLTGDVGPASTAHSLNIPFILIPDHWRRPLAMSEKDKKIKKLENENSILKSAEPKIVIGDVEVIGGCPNSSSKVKGNIIEVIQKLSSPLTKSEIEDALSQLRRKHPMVEDFTPPPPSVKTASLGQTIRTEYSSPPADSITLYHKRYSEWINQWQSVLENLHQTVNKRDCFIKLQLPISNDGRRPASNVRVEFTTLGSVKLKRSRNSVLDAGHELSGYSKQVAVSRNLVGLQLPSSPKPPAIKSEKTITSSFRSLQKVNDINANLNRSLRTFLNANQDAIAAVAENHQALSDLLSVNKLNPLSAVDDLSAYHKEINNSPETFHYKWPEDKPAQTDVLTRELWRHKVGKEIFIYEIVFMEAGTTSGTMTCTVHADNLTTPESARINFKKSTEAISLKTLVEEMIAKCH